MESSRQDLLNDMAEHRPILKNSQNTYNPHISFTPKTDIAFPETGFCLYCITSYSDRKLFERFADGNFVEYRRIENLGYDAGCFGERLEGVGDKTRPSGRRPRRPLRRDEGGSGAGGASADLAAAPPRAVPRRPMGVTSNQKLMKTNVCLPIQPSKLRHWRAGGLR